MTAIITHGQYLTERHICRVADSYWRDNASFDKSGVSSMSKELAAHPDYAACSNEMRGRVEQYELNRDKPERFTAYVSSQGEACTVWTGLMIGRTTHAKLTKRHSAWMGKVYHYTFETIWGQTYAGYGACGCCINLKRVG